METETISYEEKEQQLVNDCVKELSEYTFPQSASATLQNEKALQILLSVYFIMLFIFLPHYSYSVDSCCYSSLASLCGINEGLS